MGHSCGTLLRGSLVGHSCKTLFTLVCHSTLLWDTWDAFVENSGTRLLWGTLARLSRHNCQKPLPAQHFYCQGASSEVTRHNLVGHCGTLAHDTMAGTLSKLLPKLTVQVSKTSVFPETSSKGHTSSLQNKRFTRDFFQNSLVKSLQNERFRTKLPLKLASSLQLPPKRVFRARLLQK